MPEDLRSGPEGFEPPTGGPVKREAKAGQHKGTSLPKANGTPAEPPKLRPIQDLIRKICRNDHTKGILAR